VSRALTLAIPVVSLMSGGLIHCLPEGRHPERVLMIVRYRAAAGALCGHFEVVAADAVEAQHRQAAPAAPLDERNQVRAGRRLGEECRRAEPVGFCSTWPGPAHAFTMPDASAAM
jgi:hypothetical protein